MPAGQPSQPPSVSPGALYGREAGRAGAPHPGPWYDMTMHPGNETKREASEKSMDSGPPDMANSQLFHVSALILQSAKLERRPSFTFCLLVIFL